MTSELALRSTSSRLRGMLLRLLSIGDLPGDDDDTLLRKRVGVVAGYVTIVVPFGVVLGTQTQPFIGWAAALGLSLFSVANLVVLARTKRFERFVIALIGAGTPFAFFATILIGGATHSGGALVWGFLSPAFALLALGPRRATPWFFAFIGLLILSAAVDPFVGSTFPALPYPSQLVFYVQNIGLPLTIIFVLLRYVDVRRRRAEARSEELLTNAIPSSIAYRLRHGESRIAESYPDTTIVFVDIANFTPWAQRTDPVRVVSLLDDLFSRFDHLVAAHGLEKIKTVGDAYMAAAGAPQARADHAQAAVAFAQAALEAVASWRVANGIELEARVGIASGVVVGGVIGQRRMMFDLWGDTVNTAARMESSGVPGRIHVAATTRSLLDDTLGFEERRIDVKGLGPMTTYLVAA